VAKERLKSPRARLFVALDLPDAIREEVTAWQREALGDRALRPVRSEALHFTLAFLGYHPERRIEEIAAAATDVSMPAPELRLLREPVGLPRRTPRLYALEADSEATIALQAEIASRLEREGFYEPEKRPFWPHLTVARVRGEKRGSRRPARVKRAPGPLPEKLERTFVSVRLRLYRSHLQPSGAEYEPLAQVELPSES
jgi:2'-5' RNA ligase